MAEPCDKIHMMDKPSPYLIRFLSAWYTIFDDRWTSASGVNTACPTYPNLFCAAAVLPIDPPREEGIDYVNTKSLGRYLRKQVGTTFKPKDYQYICYDFEDQRLFGVVSTDWPDILTLEGRSLNHRPFQWRVV